MIKENYLYSNIYQHIDEFALVEDSVYIYGHSTEGRSYLDNDLILKFGKNVKFIELKDIGNDIIYDNSSDSEFYLRSTESMLSFLEQFKGALIYIDSSGLSNRICASLLNNSFNLFESLNLKDIKVIYAEPETYKVIQFSTEGIYNDLSESIKGIDPLPGFANIIPYENEETNFVALLGFEGGRFKYILEAIEPTIETIYPVIGVPGFRAEYPFVAYWGNRRPLDNTDVWSNVKYATANSISDVYLLLHKEVQLFVAFQ